MKKLNMNDIKYEQVNTKYLEIKVIKMQKILIWGIF